MRRRDRAAVLLCLLLTLSRALCGQTNNPVSTTAQVSGWWATDLSTDDLIGKLKDGRLFILDDQANCDIATDSLWIELTLHANEGSSKRYYRVDGWWGTGNELSSDKQRFRLKFSTPAPLGTVSIHKNPVHVEVLARLQGVIPIRGGRGVGPRWSNTFNSRIVQATSIPIYLYVDKAHLRNFLIVSDNLISDKFATSGEIRLPNFVIRENGFQVLQGQPSLVLHDLGVLPYGGMLIRMDSGNPVLKFIFDLGVRKKDGS